MGNLIAQQVTGLHTNHRGLDHAHVVFANAAGVRNGRQQEKPSSALRKIYACRVSEGGNNVSGDDTEPPSASVRGRSICQKASLNGDGAQLLALIVEQERLGAVFDKRQAFLLKSNDLAEGGVFLTFVPWFRYLPGTQRPGKGNKFGVRIRRNFNSHTHHFSAWIMTSAHYKSTCSPKAPGGLRAMIRAIKQTRQK